MSVKPKIPLPTQDAINEVLTKMEEMGLEGSPTYARFKAVATNLCGDGDCRRTCPLRAACDFDTEKDPKEPLD